MIDLSLLERERTHGFWQELEEGAGSLYLLLTISGTTASETISDLTTYEENSRERETLEGRYVSVIVINVLKFSYEHIKNVMPRAIWTKSIFLFHKITTANNIIENLHLRIKSLYRKLV